MEPSIKTVFGDVLRELRRQQGLTQERLSFACDRHRTYISLIERGRSSPTVETLWKLAAALDTTPSRILRRVERRAASAARAAPARKGRGL